MTNRLSLRVLSFRGLGILRSQMVPESMDSGGCSFLPVGVKTAREKTPLLIMCFHFKVTMFSAHLVQQVWREIYSQPMKQKQGFFVYTVMTMCLFGEFSFVLSFICLFHLFLIWSFYEARTRVQVLT